MHIQGTFSILAWHSAYSEHICCAMSHSYILVLLICLVKLDFFISCCFCTGMQHHTNITSNTMFFTTFHTTSNSFTASSLIIAFFGTFYALEYIVIILSKIGGINNQYYKQEWKTKTEMKTT